MAKKILDMDESITVITQDVWECPYCEQLNCYEVINYTNGQKGLECLGCKTEIILTEDQIVIQD